jgi:glycosyltransferase involved in cell wall biosynthesis
MVCLKKVLVLIRSLNIGGAEKQLLTLIRGIDRTKIEPVIVTFYAEGELLPEFSRQNVRVFSAEKGGRWDVIPFLSRLMKTIRTEKPDVLMTYLVAANLLGVLLKPFLQPIRVIISIRHSFVRREDYDWLSNILYSLENRLAGHADRIIVNSFTGAKMAAARGIPAEKMVVIPNGIDTDRFHSDFDSARETRKRYGLDANQAVVGIIGRLDPIKDHATLLKAFHQVLECMPKVRLVIVGSGEKLLEERLVSLTRSLGIEKNVLWIPSQNDLLGIYNMLDVCVSASIGEGFSNVISEAMACQIPCVATAVGDSVDIIGETGRIVPVGSPNVMAQAIQELLELPVEKRERLGRSARERIISQFSVEKMISATTMEIEKLGKN